jgi:hypothetical protein
VICVQDRLKILPGLETHEGDALVLTLMKKRMIMVRK